MTKEEVKLMISALVVVHWSEKIDGFSRDFIAFFNGLRPEVFSVRGGGPGPLYVRVMVHEDQWETFVCHKPSEKEGDVNICVLE